MFTERWKQLSSGTLNRRIFSAAALVAALTLATKVVAMGKEVLSAAAFGTDDAMDAFLAAFLLPTYALNVLAVQMNTALVPVFIGVRENEGEAAAQRLFSGALVLSIGILVGATILLGLLAPVLVPYVCVGFSEEKIQFTIKLFYLLLPTIVLSGLVNNCEAALNAGEKFAVAALAPAIVPLATIGAIWAMAPRWGIHSVVAGLVGGIALNLLIVARSLKRRGLSFTPRWHGMDSSLRRLISQYFPAVAASAMMCSSELIDRSMASLLAPGSVSVLSYGNKLVSLVLTMGTIALGTAVLPYFSKMVAKSDWSGLRHTLKTYIRLIILVTIPIVVLGIILSKPLVEVMFQRGKFSSSDTALVASVQSMLMLQLPFYSLSILFVRMISSLQANRLLVWGTVISVVLNISLNYLLMKVMGIAGIALSTSVVYAVSAAYLGVMLWKKLKAVSA